MAKNDQDKARALAVEDQAWIAWEEYIDDIRRISQAGPQSDRDIEIACACCHLVLGRMNMIRAEREGGRGR